MSGASAPEWVGFQEAEYKFFDHRTTWDQAQRICSWLDSSLASVHSAQEAGFLAKTLQKVARTIAPQYHTNKPLRTIGLGTDNPVPLWHWFL